MLNKPPLQFRIPVLILAGIFSLHTANAQTEAPGIEWQKDTVSVEAATKAQARFKTELNNSGKKATMKVSMEVAKLKQIMDALASRGVTNVTFHIVMIRKEDTAQYARRNPGLTTAARNDLIGRQQLVIRVPRTAFSIPMGSRQQARSSTLMASMLLMGLMPLENNFPGLPDASEDVYFGIGTICPPPASCTD